MSGEIGFNDADDYHLYLGLTFANDYLEELKAQEREFQAVHLKAWYDHRKLTIGTIEELQKKINDLCVGANVIGGVGAVAGTASIISGVEGHELEAKGRESADNFKEVRNFCGGTSIAAVASSTLLEVGLSQTFMNEIESVLKKDIELTKPLMNWVQLSNVLDFYLQGHFQYSITSLIFPKIMEVIGYCIEAIDAGHADLKHLIRDLDSCKIKSSSCVTIEVPLEVSQMVANFFKRSYNNPTLFDALRNIWKIFKEMPRIFEFAKLGRMIDRKVYSDLNSSRLSSLLSLSEIACPQLESIFSRNAFDSVTVGADVVTRILAAQNIKEGKSNYSDALDDILNELRLEQNEVRVACRRVLVT